MAKTGRPRTKDGSRRNVYISHEAWRWMNRNQNVSAEIEKLAREKMNEHILNIAHLMHGELCNCDDKHCTLTGELYDWLRDGDGANMTEADVPALVREWRG